MCGIQAVVDKNMWKNTKTWIIMHCGGHGRQQTGIDRIAPFF
jgi:hypothetical protein